MKEHNSTHSAAPAGKDTLLNAVTWLVNEHGKTVSQDVLYAGLPRGEILTPAVAVRMLEQTGIHAGWMKRDLLTLPDDLFPAIIATTAGDYTLLLGKDGERFILLDPVEEEINHLTSTELSECYAGYA